MLYRVHSALRSTLPALVALGTACGATTLLAQNAGTTDTVGAPSQAERAGPVLERAAALLEAGQLVRAQQTLVPLATGGALDLMTESERARAGELLSTANARLKQLDPIEVSLQRGEVALDSADVRTAEAQSAAVARSPKASAEQQSRAGALASQAAALKAELVLRVPAILDGAIRDFEAGRYVEAKVGLAQVRRSGVALSPKQSAKVETYQNRIVDLEQESGRAFDTTGVAASMMQPGVVKKPEPKPSEPANQPSSQPPAEPAPTPAPAAAEPLLINQPPPQPTQPPAGDQVQDSRRYAAQSQRAEADTDFAQSRYNSAIAKYNRLLSEFRDLLTAEETAEITRRIDESKVRMGANVGGGVIDPLQERIEKNRVMRAQAIAEFENQQTQARSAIESGDTNRAHDLGVMSRQTILNARNAFSEAEFEEYQKKVDALLRDVDRSRADLNRREAEERARRNKELQEQETREASDKREKKIREAILRVRELQQQLDYASALQVVNEQILFLDPINPAGLILKDILSDAMIFTTYADVHHKIQQSVARERLEGYKAMVAPMNIIEYPTDWPAISARRGEQIAFADTAEDRRVRTALANDRQPVDFGGVRLADAVQWVREIARVNVDVNWQSLEAMQVTPDTLVTLQLTRAVPLTAILDKVAEKVSPDERSRVGWTVEDGGITIASEDVLRKNTPVLIYDIKDLLVEVPDFTDAPNFDLQSVLRTSQSGGSGASPFQGTGGDSKKTLGGAERRSRDERVRELVDIIEQHIDPTGWKDLGGSTGSIQHLNGSLIITNTPANHQAISGLLAKLREVRAMQINVETRFLLVNSDFFEQIGFDLDVYFNANNNQVNTARATNPATQASDFFTDGRLNRTVNVPTVTPPGTANTFGVVPPRAGFSPVGAQQNSNVLTGNLLQGQVDPASTAGVILAGAPALGIAGQFLDDIQVDFLITATQADRRTVRLNAPRLTFTNGQTSNIYVATQQAFVSELSPVVSESAVGFDPTLNTISEGVVMLVEGTISSDRRYVTLNIDTSVSKIDQLVNFPVTAVAGGRLINSADTQSFIQLPTVTVTRVSTTVNVPDQGTVLLGGQRLVNEFEVETGVPVLSKIPIINRFFSNRITAKEEQTLMILLKPTVLIQSENEDQNFPGLVDALRTPFSG